MKKIFKISAILMCCSAVLSLSSCNNEEFLTTTQYDIVNSTAMYESDANAIMGMTGVYDMMVPDGDEGQNTGDWGFKPNLFTGCHPTIDTQATGWDKDWNVQNWNASSSELLQGWQHAYIGISRANDFLAGLETSGENLTPSVASTLEGEGRAARAFFYHWLAVTFGRVPMLETGETYSNTPQKAKAETYVEMWNFIINDLEAAVDLLDWTPMDGQYGRCTKGMALSYLGDAYMWKAYRMTDGANGQAQTSQPDTLYQKAYDAFQKVLNSGVYELNKSFTTLWDMAGVWDKEAIWEEVLDEGENWGNWSNYTSRMFTKYYTACPENGGWGSLFLSWEWWSSYESGDKRREASGMTGAVPQIDPNNPKYESQYAGWYEENVYGYNPYCKVSLGTHLTSLVDPTKDSIDVTTGRVAVSPSTKTHQFHFYNGEYAPAIWSLKFWRNARGGWDGDTWCPTQIHWKRLPNVMLDYAECCFNLGKDAEGWEQIDKLRNRAFGNLEVGNGDALTAKYLPPIQSMIQFYANKGQSDVDIPQTYPLPFNTQTVTVPRAEEYYQKVHDANGYDSEVWRVAVNIERRKEFNCEWCLTPDLHKSNFLADHVTHAYPKRSNSDLTDIPWTNRDYDYNELKMDMPIPADEITKNPLCDQNPGY